MPFDWTPETIKELLEKRAQGYSASEIAKALDTTRSSVLGKLHRMQVSTGKRVESNIKIVKTDIPKIVHHHSKYNTMSRGENPTFVKETDEAHKARTAPISKIEPVRAGILMGDLSPHQCLYAYGDGPFHFCGRDKQGNSSYCPDHKTLTSIKTNTRRKSIEDLAGKFADL